MRGAPGIFAGALGVTGNTLLIFFAGIYLALQPELYKRGLVRLAPLSYRERTADLLDKIGSQLGWWIVGRFISMVAVAVLTIVALEIMGTPLAFLLGIFSGLTSFVPVIGPLAAAIPAMLIGLLEGPHYVLYIGIVYAVVQALETYLLMPFVNKKVVDLPPALLIVVQVLIGLLTGIVGLILATPILVMMMVLAKHAYIHDALGERQAVASEEAETA